MAQEKAPAAVLPFVHQLFHRPGPVPSRQDDGRVIWRCSCGACWVE